MNQSSACAGLQWPTSPRLSQPCSAVTARTCRCRWSRGGGSHRDVHQEVWGQVREGGHLSGQGPGRAADLLGLSGRALGSPADVQPDRERVRHRTVRTKGAVARHGPADGIQAGDGCGQDLAPAEGREPAAQSRPGRHIRGWRRGHRHASTKRRLITPSPKFKHRSLCGSARHTDSDNDKCRCRITFCYRSERYRA